MANANRRPAAIFRTLAAIEHRYKEANQDDPASFNHDVVSKRLGVGKAEACHPRFNSSGHATAHAYQYQVAN